MAQTRRTVRPRAAANDENAPTAAARPPGKPGLAGSVAMARSGPSKPALGAKSTTTTTLGVRKRAALGEVNTNANDVAPPAQDAKPTRGSLGAGVRTRSNTTLAATAGGIDDVIKPRLTRRTSALGTAPAALPLAARPSNIPRRTSTAAAKPPSRRGRVAVDVHADDDEDGQPVAKRARTVAHEVAPVEPPAKDEGWEDLDAGDEDDPMMVTTYVNEVYVYLKELEVATKPDPRYIDRQPELTWVMRRILIDWLIDVHGRFRLLPETIFLAAHIVDRFLSVRVVHLVKFQLVGVAALFIAAKYEEVVCPSVRNFLFMTDGGYEEEEILKAERYILQLIGFDLSYPNPIHFLRRISKADGYDIQTRTIAKYFLEMTVVDHLFLDHLPSVTAAAATWLSRKVLGRGGDWCPNLIHYSTYTEEELLPAAQLMLDFVVRDIRAKDCDAPQFHKKYSVKKYYKASEVVKTWVNERYYPASLRDQPIRLEEWAAYGRA